jgi:two-component system OmpR family sensor kinase/two-component system sensor histidine kinase BaeS
MFVFNFLAFALFSGVFDEGGHRGPWPFVPILAIGLIVAFFFAGRAVRGMAGRVGDVMEAADRVASGDYTVKLQERGPGEMRRLARSFNAMTGRLRTNEEQRRNLLADLAHELRTPLSVIQGNLEGMLDGLYASDRSHIEPVLEETKVMARLLDDLQTLSRAEAGALKLHRETVQPDELVADAVAAFGPRANAEGVRLEQRVAPELPSVDVDPVRITEVFANLLLNALQHTPPGGSVMVSAVQFEDDRVLFEVADTGPGIPPDTLPHVFDRFVKAVDSDGAGLGLAIAKSLVEAHGGEIVAESPPGGGTTMRFGLPVAG